MNSPIYPVVRPAATNAAVSVAYGKGLHAGIVGNVHQFTIQAKDTYGNNREDAIS